MSAGTPSRPGSLYELAARRASGSRIWASWASAAPRSASVVFSFSSEALSCLPRASHALVALDSSFLALSACFRRASTLLGEGVWEAEDRSEAPDTDNDVNTKIAAIGAAGRGLRTGILPGAGD